MSVDTVLDCAESNISIFPEGTAGQLWPRGSDEVKALFFLTSVLLLDSAALIKVPGEMYIGTADKY